MGNHRKQDPFEIVAPTRQLIVSIATSEAVLGYNPELCIS